MGRAASTVSRHAPGRPRERHHRLSADVRRRPASALPSPSPSPSRFPLLRPARAFCALAAAALFLSAALGAAPAAAQTTLVSNTGQASTGSSITIGPFAGSTFRQAIGFTTGGNAGGYELSSVDVGFAANTGSRNANVKASIYSTTSSGAPDRSLYVLTDPATAPDSAVGTFTAPTGASLKAGTSYVLVLEADDNSATGAHFITTNSNAEDSGAATGWSIADSRHWSQSNGAWTTTASKPRFAVKGKPKAQANAGDDQSVYSGESVTLTGSGTAPGGGTANLAWTQPSGPTVTLGGSGANPKSFTAPTVTLPIALTFKLRARAAGAADGTDTVTVTVLPPVETSTNSAIASATVDGTALTVVFDRELKTDSTPSGSAFTVTATKPGSSRIIAGTGAAVSISGKTVAAVLSAAVAPDEALKVRYDRPASGAVLQDTASPPAALASVADRSAVNAAALPPDTGAPTFVSGTVDGATATLTFSEPLDENSVPFISTLHLLVGFAATSTTQVTISGRVVTLTLTGAVPQGATSTRVRYRPTSSSPALQDVAGNSVAANGSTVFWSVTNITPGPDTDPPTFVSGTVNGAAVTLTFSEALDGSSVPPTINFVYRVGGEVARHAIGILGVSGKKVTFTLSRHVLTHGQTLRVGYFKPTSNPPLQDLSGNDVESFPLNTNPATGNGVEVTNITPPGSPSAAVNGTTLTVTFNGALDTASKPASSAFTVTAAKTVSGTTTTRTINGASTPVSISGAVVTVSLTGLVNSDETATVAYTAPMTNPLKDSDNAKLPVAAFSGVSATRTADTDPPTFVSGTVNGAAVTLTFSEALDGSSVPPTINFVYRVGGEVARHAIGILGVSGKKVTFTLSRHVLTHGQTLRVGYFKPTSNPLQDLSGNDVESFPLNTDPATGNGVEVTNITPAPFALALAAAAVDGTTVTLTFPGELDSTSVPATGAFKVSADGVLMEEAVVGVAVDGKAVTLTLARAVAAHAKVTVRYDRASAGSGANGPLQIGGVNVASFANAAAVNVTPTAETRIASVAIGSTPRAGNTYGAGEYIRVRVTWSADVVWKVPAGAALSVTLNVNGRDRTAALVKGAATRGGRARSLLFGYKVASGDTVVANTNPDKLEVKTSATGELVALAGAATLVDGQGRAVSRKAGGLSGPAGQKVNGDDTTADATPPVLVDATADGGTVTLTFDEDLRTASATPSAKDLEELRISFTLQGGRHTGSVIVNQGPEWVAVSGATVTLSFKAQVAPGQSATVFYRTHGGSSARSLGHNLRDAAGNWLTGFSKVVTNATPPAAPPVALRGQVDGSTLTLVFDKGLDAGSRPSGSRFRVGNVLTPFGVRDENGNYIDNRVSGTGTARIRGATVTVTLASNPPGDEEAWVFYDKRDDANPLRGTDEVEVERIGLFRVDQIGDATAPTSNSGSVSGKDVTLYFSEALDGTSVPAASAFPLTVGGTAVPNGISEVAVRGSAVFLTLASVPADGAAVTVAYTATGGGALRDLATNNVAAFTAITLTNEGTTAPGAAPALLGPVSANLRKLTLTFDQPLDPTKVPVKSAFALNGHYTGVNLVTVRGSTVELRMVKSGNFPCGQEVYTLAYAKPATNALQNRWGMEAEGFSAHEVENEGCPMLARRMTASKTAAKVQFDEPLEPQAAPRTAHFTAAASSGPAVPVTGAAMTADGAGVALTLGRSLADGEALTVSYRRPRGEVGLWTADSRQLADFDVTGVAGVADETPPQLLRGEIDGATMTLHFSEPLDPDATGGRFLMGIQTSETDSMGCYADGGVTVDGATATVGLGEICPPALAGLEGNDVTYFRRAGGGDGALRDLAGNLLAMTGDAGTGLYVKIDLANVTGMPRVTGVAVVSDAGNDATYALGEKIRVALTFDTAVAVDTAGGTPGLTLELDPAEGGETRARYASGAGTDTLVFAHAVAQPNLSTEGVAVLADTLALDGGTITSAETQIDARLGHAGLAHDPAHLVDWRLAPPAAVTAVAVVSDPGDDTAYAAGETVQVAVTFTEAVDVDTEDGTPRLALDLGGDGDAGERWAAYESGTGTATLTFAWTAGAPDEAPAGLAVLADTLEPDGGTIRSAATQADAALAHAGVAADPAHRVDGAPPRLVRGEIDGATMTLHFSEALDPAATGGSFMMSVATPEHLDGMGFTATGAVAVDGATVTVGMGARMPHATAGLTEGNWVLYRRLADGSGGPLRDLAGNPVLTPHRLTSGDEEWRYVKIDLANVTGGGPAVTGVAVVSDASDDDTYALGEKVRVAVTFGAAVEVDTTGGTPALAIDMDPAHWGEKRAAYESGSGTATLVFAHEVVEPNLSTRGVAVLANTLALNGATIRSAATQADAGLGHAGLAHDANHKVDWRTQPEGEGPGGTDGDGGPPSVTGVSVVSSPGSGDTYLLGETIRVRVTFDAAVAVTGSPGLKIDMDPAAWGEKRAAYEEGTGTSSLTFAHTVVEPNYSTQGIAVLANTLAPGGGTIRSAASGTDAVLGHGGLGHAAGHKVDWRPAVSVADARADEGANATVDFEVSLSRAFTTAAHSVTVDYATADGTATAGEDYTATSGTLTFAAGESSKTVSVTVLDDAIDEGEETFSLSLSNAAGARIGDGEATGTIANDDPLQKMWLSRFGRTVADHVTGAVSDRLSGPLTGAQVTVGGQSLDLAAMEDEARLGETLTALARALGAAEGPESGDDGGLPGASLGGGAPPVLDGSAMRSVTGRELLLGSTFHLAREGDGGGPGLAAWGRMTVGGFDGEAPSDGGAMRIDGEVTTGILGTDAEWDRLLAGVAVSLSQGEGTFAVPEVDSGTIESTMTTVSPYARVTLSDRVSAWGLVGFGTGDMTLVQAANARGQPERVTRTDLSMRLGAVGGRGALLQADETGGMDLALKADAFLVQTTSEAISNEGDTTADASRVRLILEGSRAFRMEGGGVFTPGLELGVRHDGGDAETGTGVELGGRVSWTDPETGVSVEANVRTLVAHEDSGYEEWGASGAVRLDPGAAGRGLSLRLAPTWGSPSSGMDRLWSARDARALAPDGEFEPERRLEGELGYGLPAFGGGFTGTPYVGFGLSGGDARDYRIGWRLGLARSGPATFDLGLEATRREAVGDAPEHGVRLGLEVRF